MKRKILAMILALTMAGTLLAGCQSSSGGTQNEAETPEEPVELYVFIAASLSNAMEELKTMYQEENPNVDIKYNADSSGTLQTQIEEGCRPRLRKGRSAISFSRRRCSRWTPWQKADMCRNRM